MSAPAVTLPPVLEALDRQPRAAAALAAAVPGPVHAYLLVGPAGPAKAAAVAFGAALLCPDGGCGRCRVCQRVLGGNHPDLVLVERVGASINVDQAREITRVAARSPLEGERKVLVLTDFHLVGPAAPALLKTLEEPSPSTILVVTAERITPELVTIASRCVKVEVADPGAAVVDEAFQARMAAWKAVPDRLDGTGAAAIALATELIESLDAAVEPVRARQAEEAQAAAARAKATGERANTKETEERQRREQRRARMDELRAGLVQLSVAYRDRLVAARSASEAEAAARAAATIGEAGRELIRNPNESLMLQVLFLRIGK